jgi:hypothetical protein
MPHFDESVPSWHVAVGHCDMGIDGGGEVFWMKCPRRSVISVEAGLPKATKGLKI